MGRRLIFGVLVTLLVVALTAMGCSPQSTPQPVATATPSTAAKAPEKTAPPAQSPVAAASQPLEIKIGAVSTVTDSGFFIAIAKGYFAEQGLKASLEMFKSPSEIVPAISTNQIAAGKLAVNVALLNAFASGVDARLVADGGSIPKGFGFHALVIRKDLIDNGSIKTLPDLKGKTLGSTSPAGAVTTLIPLDVELKKIGMSIDDIKWVGMGLPEMVVALDNKAIDGAIITEPNVVAAQDKGVGVRWKGLDEMYPGLTVAAIAYSPDFARKDGGDWGKRFMVAYLKGVRDYNDAFAKGKNKADIVAILAKSTGLAPELFDKMVPAGLDPNGELSRTSLNDIQDWFVGRAAVKQKLDLGKFIDDSFAKYATGVLGPYK